MLQHEQTVLKLLYDERIINIVRKYFKSKVVFSGRPSIHIHDSEGDRFLVTPRNKSICKRFFVYLGSDI